MLYYNLHVALVWVGDDPQVHVLYAVRQGGNGRVSQGLAEPGALV